MPETTIGFLNVGQGDASVIILPDKTSAVVIDCFSIEITGSYLEQKNITKLPYIFLTHTDYDHAKNIPHLLNNFADGNTVFLYNPDTLYPQEKKQKKLLLRKLCKLIEQRGLTIYNPRANNNWHIQEVSIQALHPDANSITQAITENNTNNACIVLKITYAKHSVLFAADVMGEGWRSMFNRNTDLQADVFKFPHHGAWYEAKNQQPDLADVLQQVNPSLVILSVGTTNAYNHPHPNTFNLLASKSNTLGFLCTQATKHCHALSSTNQKPFKCADTIEVTINQNKELSIVPNKESHLDTIKSFNHPQCLK